MTHRKIKFNVWRDPTPKPVDYLPPHCHNNNCNYCAERRRRKRQAATDALNAANTPGMFWDRKIERGIDVLGYWPPGSTIASYVKRG